MLTIYQLGNIILFIKETTVPQYLFTKGGNLRSRGYGYKLGPNVKHGAVKPPYSQRFVRLRSLGEDYTEERIKERIIMGRNGIRILSKPKEPKHYTVKGRFSNAKKIKLKGFMALYFHYL